MDVNLESRSDTMSWGRPCRRQISHAKIRSRSWAFFLSISRGMKWAIFENRSITTHNSVQLFDRGRSVMKSMAIHCHWAYGSFRGERSPYLLWRRNLSLWQSGHACIYFLMQESIPGHQKFRLINSMVLSCPKCPATLLSCSDSRIVSIIVLVHIDDLGSGECRHSPRSGSQMV